MAPGELGNGLIDVQEKEKEVVVVHFLHKT